MIPKAAIKAFLNQPRDDLRQYKKLTKQQLDDIIRRLPIRPPIWSKLRFHQKVGFVIGAQLHRVAFWYDMGCVTGDTLIETDLGPRRIDDLTKAKSPIRVLSFTNNGVRFVNADCPFLKGYDLVYRVDFESGRSITVAKNHYFLTERGWISCASLLVGERLPKFDVYHPQSISGISLSEYLSDAHHSNYIQTNYQDRYYNLYDDELPHLVASSALISFPSQDGIPKHIHSVSRVDDQDISHKHNPRFAHDRHSTNHYDDLIYDQQYYMEYQPSESEAKQLAGCIYTSELNQICANHPRPVLSDLACRSYSQSNDRVAFNPPFDSVVSITCLGKKHYYDMHVPLHENYIAHGLCHHNTGKTLMSIALALYLRNTKQVKRVLILVPNNINRYEWRREIRKHSPETSCVVLDGSTENKWNLLRGSDAFLVITTYMGLLRMVCELRVSKKENRFVPNKKLMREIVKTFDCLINDESTSVSNLHTLPFRICRQIAKNAKAVFNLSGTPFGRDPTPLWAQMFLIDKGESIGANLGIFRTAFFTEKENYFSGWPEYSFDERKKGLLNKLLSHRSIRYEADQADLPSVVEIVKEIVLPQDARAYYIQARERLLASRGNYRETGNIFLRMRQISSGFLGYFDDETGTKAKLEFPFNPKLAMLISLIEAAKDTAKIVVCTDFIYSGDMIEHELKRMKIDYARVYGKTKGNAPEQLHRFDYDDNCRVFIINSAGAFGLNLQIAKFMLFYESPVSPIVRKQMERRVERQESRHNKVFRYDLIVKGTVDEQIRLYHKQGEDLLRAIMEGKVKL